MSQAPGAEISEDVLIDTLSLHLADGVGPRTYQSLISHFETPARVLAATSDELQRVDGVGPKVAASIRAAQGRGMARRELQRCRELQIELLARGAANYPRRLLDVCDPPAVLYCRGTFQPADGLAVGIVGSRHCSLYGRQQAERLAGGLARAGVTVVSGLARGIDGAAHKGALDAGGRTIAVLATGVVKIYPPEHAALAEEVIQAGVLISEAPLEQAAVRGIFPQRNRVISGLSMAVIIVEATRTSGSLHTARHALEQGREVFAMPGRIDSPASEGCHDLIRDGATLVRNVDDVLQSLGPLSAPVQTATETVHDPRELTLNEIERQILNLITADPLHIDEVLRSASIDASRVLQTVTILEMKRFIRRLPGGNLCRA